MPFLRVEAIQCHNPLPYQVDMIQPDVSVAGQNLSECHDDGDLDDDKEVVAI